MNNDLEQFSEERLKELLATGKYAYNYITSMEMRSLIHIALAAKQAKPVANVSDDDYQEIYWTKYGQSLDVGYGADLYTTPQPAHTEQVIPDGWKLVPIEPTEDMVINGFESKPDKSFTPDIDWEAYDAMSGCEQAAHRAKLCWQAMLRAAPKPESER